MLLSSHAEQQQHCRAVGNCGAVICAPQPGCWPREGRGKSSVSQLRSESCAHSRLHRGARRGKAAIASLGTGNTTRWLVLWQKSEGCTRSPKSLQCARKHKLSSYSAVCKSNVFNSRRAISKPSTLTTARVCSKVKGFNITYSFAVKY